MSAQEHELHVRAVRETLEKQQSARASLEVEARAEQLRLDGAQAEQQACAHGNGVLIAPARWSRCGHDVNPLV